MPPDLDNYGGDNNLNGYEDENDANNGNIDERMSENENEDGSENNNEDDEDEDEEDQEQDEDGDEEGHRDQDQNGGDENYDDNRNHRMYGTQILSRDDIGTLRSNIVVRDLSAALGLILMTFYVLYR